MRINGNNDNISNILNTAKCNKIIYLGDIITFKSNIIYGFYYNIIITIIIIICFANPLSDVHSTPRFR